MRIISWWIFLSIIVVGPLISVTASKRIIVIIIFGGLFGVNLTITGALYILLIVIVIIIGILVPLSH
jgi:hypothetical protein